MNCFRRCAARVRSLVLFLNALWNGSSDSNIGSHGWDDRSRRGAAGVASLALRLSSFIGMFAYQHTHRKDNLTEISLALFSISYSIIDALYTCLQNGNAVWAPRAISCKKRTRSSRNRRKLASRSRKYAADRCRGPLTISRCRNASGVKRSCHALQGVAAAALQLAN